MKYDELFKEIKENHLAVGRVLLGQEIFPLDFLAVAILNRSLCNSAAFTTLMAARNFIGAAPFIRFQIDNALRFYASLLVDEPHEFAKAVLEGSRVSRLKDRSGKKLTDGYLVETLMADDRLPFDRTWIKSTYEATSGYVHLSEKHILNSVTTSGPNALKGKISEVDSHVPDQVYQEGVLAFCEATKVTLTLVSYWAQQKNSAANTRHETNRSAPTR